MSQSRDEVVARLRGIKGEIVDEFGIRELSLFGSVARGEQTTVSDVDILVEFEDVPTLFEMGRLQARLEDELGASVDLVTPGGLGPRTLSRARDDAIAV